MTVTLLLSGRAKNKAKCVTFRLSGHASRAIYATNKAIGIFGHAWTANKGLVKLVTGEAKGHTPKGLKVGSKMYSTPLSGSLTHRLPWMLVIHLGCTPISGHSSGLDTSVWCNTRTILCYPLIACSARMLSTLHRIYICYMRNR
jgi:hypothetical protein